MLFAGRDHTAVRWCPLRIGLFLENVVGDIISPSRVAIVVKTGNHCFPPRFIFTAYILIADYQLIMQVVK